MPDDIRLVDYYYAIVPDKPGEAARLLGGLRDAGVNLLGFSGFPHGARKAQLDFLPEDAALFRKAAKSLGLTISKKMTGFLIRGGERPGAAAETLSKLAEAGINVTAVQVVCAGAGRYGGLLWVKAPDLRKAAKALSASRMASNTPRDPVDDAIEGSFPASDPPPWTP